MKKIYFKTFGCRTNIYDTQILKENIQNYIITSDENEADFIVINSCTVTNKADISTRAYINKCNKLNKKVIIAGCGAMSKGESFYKKNKVFGVLGHSQKQNLNTLLNHDKRFFELGDLKHKEEKSLNYFEKNTKAFIKIQEGCNFKCSYCIIPQVRGKARSFDEKNILNQINTLAQNGYSEFVLTGTNIGSYGIDTKTSLGRLLAKISLIKNVKRIRLGSIEPSQIDESFLEIIHENFIEKHLHIALQHTSEKMLKIMKRRNHFKSDIKLFSTLADFGFALGTDFITGHPGESEEIWQEALNNFKLFPLTHLHGFTFSKRDLTPSAFLNQDVTHELAKHRLKQLQDVVMENNLKFRQNKQVLDILVEQEEELGFSGYDQFFNKIYIKSNKNLKKQWIKVGKYEAKKTYNYTIL